MRFRCRVRSFSIGLHDGVGVNSRGVSSSLPMPCWSFHERHWLVAGRVFMTTDRDWKMQIPYAEMGIQ